jgi:hypothetical protein
MKARDIVGDADPRVAELLTFWNTARGGHRFPAQADLNLTDIPDLLPNLFILDVLDDHAFGYRFIGSRIDEHMGMSLTGKVFTQTRSGRVLREITAFFSRVVDQGVMGLLETRLPSERFEWVRYVRMALPLADDHQTVNKIVGLYLFEPTKEDAYDMPKIGDIDSEELGEVESRFGDLGIGDPD